MPTTSDTVFSDLFTGQRTALRLCLVTETFPPEINGVAMTLRRLVDGLCQRGHRVMVVRPRQHADPARRVLRHGASCDVLVPGLPIPGYGSLRFGLPATDSLIALWRRWRPQVVHVATEGPLGQSALSAARALGIPVTSTFHTDFEDYCSRYGFAALAPVACGILRRFHNRTLVSMVPSEDLARRLARTGFRNVVILARGVDTELFNPTWRDPSLRAAWGVDKSDLVIIHVGRVAHEKNLPLLFRAVDAVNRQRAAQQLPPATLVVAGDGPLRDRLRQAHPQVIFTGILSAKELSRHYASADVFLFPSMSETFGNVFLEAMASGLACVAFSYAAPARHARDDIDALLVPFGDAEAFINAAVRVCTSTTVQSRLRAAARHSCDGIGWDRVISRFEFLLASAANASIAAVRARLAMHDQAHP